MTQKPGVSHVPESFAVDRRVTELGTLSPGPGEVIYSHEGLKEEGATGVWKRREGRMSDFPQVGKEFKFHSQQFAKMNPSLCSLFSCDTGFPSFLYHSCLRKQGRRGSSAVART